MTNRMFTIKHVGGDPLYRAQRATMGKTTSYKTHQTVLLPGLRLHPGKTIAIPLFAMTASKKEVGDAVEAGVTRVWVNTDRQIPKWELTSRAELLSALEPEWEPPLDVKKHLDKTVAAVTNATAPGSEPLAVAPEMPPELTVAVVAAGVIAIQPTTVTPSEWPEGAADADGPVALPVQVESNTANILKPELGQPFPEEAPAEPLSRDVLATWTIRELRDEVARRNLHVASTSKGPLIDALCPT